MKMTFPIITIFIIFFFSDANATSPSVGLTRHRVESCSDYYSEDILDPEDHMTPIRSYGIAPEYDVYFFARKKNGEESPVKGVRLNVTVTGHRNGDPEWGQPNYDIWDDYGFIVYWNDGISDKDGLSYAAVGVGDPEIVNPDTWTPGGGWINADRYPRSYDSYVWLVSRVSLKFSAKKPWGEIMILGGANFVGRWYWDAGWQYGGFWDSPYQAFYAEGWFQNPSSANILIKSISMKNNDNSSMVDSNLLSREEPQDYNITHFGWSQLKSMDDINYDWESFDIFAAMFFDPCEPNGSIDLMSYCEPYAYIADINIPGSGNSSSTSYIMLLKSLDANDNIVSKMPIRFHVQSKQGDTVRLVSDYFLPMEVNSQQGIYEDHWNNKYRCIYAVENGSLDINEDDFYGDFDLNGFTDFKDYSLLVSHWDTLISEANYDYGFDHNKDGAIYFQEIIQFCDNYLKFRQ